MFLERAARAVRLRAVDRALLARDRRARRASCARGSRPKRVLAAIERYRVTVLAAVSTQFVMMLNSPARSTTTTCRRCASCSPAARWCRTSGPRSSRTAPARTVLQFYGSNETGALSCTTPRRPAGAAAAHRGPGDPRDARAAARPRHRRRHHRDRRPGRARGQGPDALPRLLGRRRGERASCSPPTAGCAWATSRRSTPTATSPSSAARRDFIIRGGKNISAAQVEDEVASHPAVALCAAVAMPDETFGERVCVFVELRAGYDALTLDELTRAPRRSAAPARSCGPNGSWCSTSSRGRPAARSPRASSPPAPERLHEMVTFGAYTAPRVLHLMEWLATLY